MMLTREQFASAGYGTLVSVRPRSQIAASVGSISITDE
jgi:hypothetical protein